MSVRSIMCPCGTNRPGNEARCPACGRAEGREVLERALTPRTPVTRPRGMPTGDTIGCGLCGLARVRPTESVWLICPFCDTVRDID
ncbi:MAG: hypothetical protein ACYDEN_01285 [Acidimicrobiales bacterium]